MNTEKINNDSNEPESLKRKTSSDRLSDFLTHKEQTTLASLKISSATFKPNVTEHKDHHGCGCPKAEKGGSYGFVGK